LSGNGEIELQIVYDFVEVAVGYLMSSGFQKMKLCWLDMRITSLKCTRRLGKSLRKLFMFSVKIGVYCIQCDFGEKCNRFARLELCGTVLNEHICEVILIKLGTPIAKTFFPQALRQISGKLQNFDHFLHKLTLGMELEPFWEDKLNVLWKPL
jgi:hypothetical protein